jgi:xanthine dehydrogenase accessory factor
VAEGILAEAAELERRGEPFALATVVRCEPPTSAKPGAKALIRKDGTVAGWIGGACAEPVIAREALDAMRDGRPRLVGLVGEGTRSLARAEGITAYPMTCHSGGTLEIYVEPYLPNPLLVLVGHGPVVDALAALGRAAGYAVATSPDAALDLPSLTSRASVVVATHADADEAALERVLATPAGYVSLVASRRRGAAILERLRERGVAAERLARVKAPAGLDIGAVTPAEIAVSILAEIIQRHRGEKIAAAEPLATPAPGAAAQARDPVCGMQVEMATARFHSEAAGRAVYFCCRGCQEAFARDPQRYLAAPASPSPRHARA